MFKILFLLVGLAVGFGGGIYWGHKNPEAAAKISAEEERRFLEAQVAMNQKIKAKLDQLNAPASKAPGSGFVGAGQAPNAAQVNDAKADVQKQEDELQAHLAKLK